MEEIQYKGWEIVITGGRILPGGTKITDFLIRPLPSMHYTTNTVEILAFEDCAVGTSKDAIKKAKEEIDGRQPIGHYEKFESAKEECYIPKDAKEYADIVLGG